MIDYMIYRLTSLDVPVINFDNGREEKVVTGPFLLSSPDALSYEPDYKRYLMS